MDRLVNYIKWRIKKYGNCEETTSATSMYYQFGNVKIRISDHMKYSADLVNDNDYYFIVQPNSTYIFATAPKYNKDNKLYYSIKSYNEAKEFIKSIHDSAIKIAGMTDWFRSDFKYSKDTSVDLRGRYTWENFLEKYFNNMDANKQLGICNRIEQMTYGKIQKGNLETKLQSIGGLYENLSNEHYNLLMSKLEI